MQIAWPQFQSKISRFSAKRSNGKISPFAIFAASMVFVLMATPGASAQTLIDTATIDITAAVTNGCQWSAGAGSALTVNDNEICRITGTETATSVYVEMDNDEAGQDGGKLIIGYASGTGTTTFTVSGDVTIGNNSVILAKQGGLLWIGGDSADTGTGTSTLVVADSNHEFYGYAGSLTTIKQYGEITTTADSNEIHLIDNSTHDNPGTLTNYGDIATYELYIGKNSSSNGGTLNNESGGTIHVTSTNTTAMEIYKGLFTNKYGSTFTKDGQMNIRGDTNKTSIFNNYGIANTIQYDYVREYGEFNLKATITEASTYTYTIASRELNAISTSGATTAGKITIDRYATLANVRNINVGEWSYPGELENSGTISTTDTVLYINVKGGGLVTNKNYGTIDFKAGAINLGSGSSDPTNDTLTNEIGGEIESSTSTGSINLYHGSQASNSGDVNIGAIRVSDGANSGALFYNDGTLESNETSYIGYNSGGGGGKLENDGTYTANGALIILETDGLLQNDGTLNANNQFSIYSNGVLENNDTLTKGVTGTLILNAGEYHSSGTSTLNLNNTTGFQINDANAKAELDGTITGTQSIINGDRGYLCVGNYDWVGSTCSHNATGSLSIYHTSSGNDPVSSTGGAIDISPTGSNSFDLDIENDITVDGSMRLGYGSSTNLGTLTADQGSDSTITILKNNATFAYLLISGLNTTATFNGDVDIKNTTADSDHGYMQVYYGADATFNGSGDIGSIYMYSGTSVANDTTLTIGDGGIMYLIDWETCKSGLTGNCALEIGPHDYNDNTILNIEGDIEIENSGYRTGTPISRIGYTSNSNGGEEIINVLSGATWDGYLSNNTSGTFYTQLSGEINTQYTDPTHYGIVDIQGQAHLNGTGDIDGSFDTHDLLWSQDDGDMTVGMNGVMDANGSQTTIDGDLQLDGTVNPTRATAGDVVVQSGGNITSGPGTSTNFIINANDFTVDSGGSVSSDEVSTYGSHAGAGSYGGEGTGRSGGTTYGKTRMNIDDTATYGEAGRTAATVDVNGGGGVRINANGNIDINGTISANGAASSNSSGGSGAGGTVILIHDIDHTDTSATFTGAGTISANGGSSSTASVPVGGGGKIVIDSILYDDPMDDTGGGEYGFTGTVQAIGGTNSADSAYAAAGTIALFGDDNAGQNWIFTGLGTSCLEGCPLDGTLIVDQGGNAPTTLAKTVIFDTSDDYDFAFERVEVRGSGSVEYESAPALSPIGCFRTSGTITGLTSCSAFPDKPDTLYINNTYTGAQSADEPSFASPVNDLIDITPSFSFIARNPTNTTEEYDNVAIQVASNTSFSTLLWDATGASTITLSDTIHDGERSEDFEYAGSALSTNTTYYVRAALADASDNQGLWSHRDMGEFYQFEITDNLQIDASGCSNSITLTDGSATGRAIGQLVRNTNGDRYGTGTCAIQASSTLTDWQILFGKAVGTTAFEDVTQTYNIDEIDNAGADCIIDTTGATQEEEYGYNITTNTSDADNTLINGGVQTNTTCSAAYNSSSSFFNIENSGSEDAIVKVTGNAISNDADFVLNMHANLSSATEHGTTYDLDTRMIITTNP
jgi:hypothetical protein